MDFEKELIRAARGRVYNARKNGNRGDELLQQLDLCRLLILDGSNSEAIKCVQRASHLFMNLGAVLYDYYLIANDKKELIYARDMNDAEDIAKHWVGRTFTESVQVDIEKVGHVIGLHNANDGVSHRRVFIQV